MKIKLEYFAFILLGLDSYTKVHTGLEGFLTICEIQGQNCLPG